MNGTKKSAKKSAKKVLTLENLYSEILELKHLLLESKEVLTMEETVFFTNLSKAYLYHLTCEKRIPYYKSQGGGRIYFKKSDLVDWLLSAKYDAISETEERIGGAE